MFADGCDNRLDEAQVTGMMGAMPKQKAKLSKQLRRIVDDCGMSRYRIWKEVGIDQGTLSRFMAGGGLSLDNIDKLASLLDLRISTDRRRQSKGR